jgi:hypothetical protein
MSLHLLKKEDQHFPCGDVAKKRWIRFVVDAFFFFFKLLFSFIMINKIQFVTIAFIAIQALHLLDRIRTPFIQTEGCILE